MSLQESYRRDEQRPLSYKLNEWLKHRRISRSMFYKLSKIGLAPQSYLVGSCRYISAEADAAWLAERQAESKSAA
jgi:predicted DNA-binding transcriptional regulator AlpA